MAVPFIQLGQCGNQVGCSFYDLLFNEGIKASPAHQCLLESFFSMRENKQMEAKAFSIDMEPKVVSKNLKMHKPWRYSKNLSLVEEEGSGNNWAYGFHVHGPHIRSRLEELFQKYSESEDYIKCFVQIQSMAGGTGSGLGSYMLQFLNQTFPKIPKFIFCIMPHLSGEVILQAYNSCLSLGTIYPQADGIFVIENDEINSICTNVLKIQKTGLENINEIIGRNMASIFFPVVNRNSDPIFSIEQNGFDYGVDLSQKVFFDPRYKLCSMKTTPHGPKDSEAFNYDSWQSIESELTYRKKHKSIAQLMILRGQDHPATIKRDCPVIMDKHNFYNYNRSGTLLDNGQASMSSLNQIIERSYNMMNKNAYMYQYQKYGLKKEDFMECMAQMQFINNNYQHL